MNGREVPAADSFVVTSWLWPAWALDTGARPRPRFYLGTNTRFAHS